MSEGKGRKGKENGGKEEEERKGHGGSERKWKESEGKKEGIGRKESEWVRGGRRWSWRKGKERNFIYLTRENNKAAS